MAGVAFFFEVAALLVAILAFVSFLSGARGVPSPPEVRTQRKGPVGGLSVVLVLDGRVDGEHSVASLLAQEYPRLELIVVLAGARLDKPTRERLGNDPRVTVLEIEKPPVGWIRRNHAYAEGFALAQHDYVLFLDGNLSLKEDGLERALSLAKQQRADLLTIFPALTATSRSERLLVPFFMKLTLAGVSMHRINDPRSDAAGGFAPFFLFRSLVYEALGGHANFRTDRFSDAALATSIKDRGYRLLVANGTELAVLHGPRRFFRIWRSWGENLHASTGGSLAAASIVAGLVVGVFTVPWALVAVAVGRMVASPLPVADSPWLGVIIVGVANVMLGIYHRRAMRNLFDIDDSLSWLQPVAALLAAMIVLVPSPPRFRLPGRRSARQAASSLGSVSG